MLVPIRAAKYSQDSLNEKLHSKAWEILSEEKKQEKIQLPQASSHGKGLLTQAEETNGKILTAEDLPRKESL